MDHFQELFDHLPSYRVIVCRRCRYAVVPDHVSRHIRDQHQSISKEHSQIIVEVVSGLDLAVEQDDVVYPAPTDSAIAGLPVHTDGLKCMAPTASGLCGFVCRQRKWMMQHCAKQHGWVNPRRRGGNPRRRAQEATDQIWIENQACQELFRTAGWRGYFGIRNNPHITDDAPRGSVDSTESGKAALEEMRRRITAMSAEDGPSKRGRYDPNPWLDHTRWETHLGQHKKWVVATIQPEYIPASNVEGEDHTNTEELARSECALKVACTATMQMILQAFRDSRIEKVGRPAMLYVNRREAGTTTSDRPFYSKLKVKTIRKYGDKFIKIMRYIWRTNAKPLKDRPRYQLTPLQKGALEAVRQICNADVDTAERERSTNNEFEFAPCRDMKDLQTACLQFWIAMFDHQLNDDDYESGLLSGLAVLGLDSNDGGWVPAINYTPTLAAIIACVRAMVISRAFRTRRREVRKSMQDGVRGWDAAAQAPSVYELVQEDVHRFMTMTQFGGTPTPLETIFTQKMYGLSIRYSTHGEGQVGWGEHDTVLYRNIRFSMEDIRSVVHGLLATIRQRMVDELLMMSGHERVSGDWRPAAVPRFDMGAIHDDHRVLEEGFSFIKDSRNEWPVDGEEWLWMQMCGQDQVGREWMVGVDESQPWHRQTWRLHPDKVHAYLRSIRRFKEELLVLVHMSAGAPARAPELISIQHENGENARSQRGVFIDEGLVAFVTTYHKGYSASQKMKIVHRFVPREVSELVVYYLWLVAPFERMLQCSAEERCCSSTWLWEPTPEEGWEKEDEEKDEGYESDEVEEEEKGEEEEEDDEEDGSEEDAAEDEGNSDGVERGGGARVRNVGTEWKDCPSNCDGWWDTDRVRRIMHRETKARIGVAIGVAAWRQVYPAIHREYAIGDDIQTTLDETYRNANPHHHESPSVGMDAARARALQATHSPEMEESIYGRTLKQNPFATWKQSNAFRRVSVDWHRFLQFPSAWQHEKVDGNVKRQIENAQQAAKMRQRVRIREMDVQQELGRFYDDPQAQFRGVQRQALDAMIRGNKQRMVVVMRTGGGKSLLFMLPAFASKEGVSIVILPKIALQDDMRERCREAGIRYAVWSDNRAPPYDAQIVFVITESAVTQSFMDFVNSKAISHQLDRIVYDECHSILQSTEEFRRDMWKLQEFAGQSVQLICMTATLPVSKEERFFHLMGMSKEETTIIRDSTTRPNIAYSVRDVESGRWDAIIQEIVEEKKRQYPMQDKIIIYCRSVNEVKRLASSLGYTPFYHDVGSNEEKREIVKMLRDGAQRVFTSTNALGEGIDAPNVRVVIHAGMTFELDAYGQESGRCGRNGRTRSEAIVLRRYRINERGRKVYQMEGGLQEEAKEFIRGGQCRRVILDRFHDGRERLNCEEGEEFCDVCEGRGLQRKRTIRVDNEVDGGSQSAATRAVKRVCRRGEEEEMEQPIEEEEMVQQSRRTNNGEQLEEASHVEVEHELRRRDYQLWEISQRRRGERIEQSRAVEQMQVQLERWKGSGCAICRIHGQSRQDHPWRRCHRPVRQEVEKLWKKLETIEWERYACCHTCWAPQAICDTFEPIDHGGPARFQQRKERTCQFRGVLREAVAAIGACHGESVDECWTPKWC